MRRPSATGAVDYRISDYGFYLQDQWRVTDRLTAMYGARYEYAQLPQPTVCNHGLSRHLPCAFAATPTSRRASA